MSSEVDDGQLLLFQRQYLQLFDTDFLRWPPKALLRSADVQSWLYRKLFAPGQYLPPARYQARVLKVLISKIEEAIQDPDEDELSDLLVRHYSDLLISLPSELTAVQQRSHVTFASDGLEVTLLERRNLISGSKTTGFRTWEAALHLGHYLLEHPFKVKDKCIMELGAGTGFIAILCAKLGAKHVTTTDGDEAVIDALKENLFLNGLDSTVYASVLRWGQLHDWVRDDCEQHPYDVIIGADIIYDKTAVYALVATLDYLFEIRPSVQVLLASVIRNEETFETFRFACSKRNFVLDESEFKVKPMHDQSGFFYATAMPIKIVFVHKTSSSMSQDI